MMLWVEILAQADHTENYVIVILALQDEFQDGTGNYTLSPIYYLLLSYHSTPLSLSYWKRRYIKISKYLKVTRLLYV